MCKRTLPLILCTLLLLVTQTGCWSSREIEDLALYSGLSLDTGKLTPTEQTLEEQGGTYSKQNLITVTLQIVPVKSTGTMAKQASQQTAPYVNLSGTGDSVLEIFRQFSIRNERPIIGHHLKVIIVSTDLLKRQKMDQLMDFVLRDNDIRPSTMVFISEGRADASLISKRSGEIPSFHIKEMISNQFRTSKVMHPVILSQLDALMHSKRSYALQNLISADGDTEFSGAGIIKGDTGHWIGALSQEDTECLSWLTNKGTSGAIKAYDWDNEPMTYEMKAMKSKIKAMVDGDDISFEVSIRTEGRLIETWNNDSYSTSAVYSEKVGRVFQEKLAQMMQKLIQKLQSDYKADVAGFGEMLSIQHPAEWKKVKDHWDDTFSKSKISFKYDLKITDFGSFTEE
ncbi:spore gernimation protein GerC [Paenibacillus sp. FSL H7-0357]|uniref:Ger(x)C family spore germination protein n=1 Tax=unclassified Paenibacillus TaxID=185978 RepID=UPI0004F9118D|nr:Ger(x)C family spore germination protein [Paenibacillus sp. FSL H7-0357]AIQ16058.1 spore gernimation protein GerC [Paenibacillus sp. FSL H7-0357]